jgi:RHH-type proline utilization regulon transcriptional repressor/proline dehydrogenase/delta 1-pyrroline-5-carboxylate dehydrogenase
MFKNEAPADFSISQIREEHAQAISKLELQLQNAVILVKPILAGKEIESSQSYLRVDPSQTNINVAQVYLADEKIAEKAISMAQEGYKIWSQRSAAERIGILRKSAEIMRAKKLDLFALLVKEAGKPWKESDADVCEAIDFIDFYASEMEKLALPYKTEDLLGEDNFHSYKSKGICVVISPWNFPLAITCGMTVAALVTGNSVILKPSRQTSAIARELVHILLEAGVDSKALSFLPAPGSIIGKLLVEDQRIHMYAFTGSKEVGLEIIKKASTVEAGQRHVKRVIAEMGGKNAIIVDQDADLDEAVKGIIYSAFGFSGQKCSACSRLIVVDSAYKPLLERLKAALPDIIVAKASDPGSLLGPVIDQSSQARILAVIEEARQYSELLTQSSLLEGGFFVPATIFKDVPVDSFLWQEEIFGPVLACRKVKTFSEAISLANDCQYALTAGLYSRSPLNIEQAKLHIEAGNFYINRACTGAIVKRHPFGGFKLSGVGSKAGGRDYLLQFLEPRLVCENTLRRGFTPDL